MFNVSYFYIYAFAVLTIPRTRTHELDVTCGTNGILSLFVAVLYFLLQVSFLVDEGVSPVLLQLLSCALCGSKVLAVSSSGASGGGSGGSSQPSQSKSSSKKSKKDDKEKDKEGFMIFEKSPTIIRIKKNSSLALFSMFLLYFLQEMELAVRKISYVQLWSVSSIDLQIRRRLFNSCVASCSSPTLPLCAGKPTASHCISTGT